MRFRWIVVSTVAALTVAGLMPARAEHPSEPPNTDPETRFVDGRPLCGHTTGTDAADDGALRVATFNVLHSDTDEGDESLGARLPLEARAIVNSGADIVGAQEVTRNINGPAPDGTEHPQRHGLVAERLAAEIARWTGEIWYWCWSRSNPHFPATPDLPDKAGGGNDLDDLAAASGNSPDPGDFSEGLAILSRFRITDARFRRLAPRSYEAPACVANRPIDPFCSLAAVFDSRQVLWVRANEMDFFTTHIAHGLTALSDTTKLVQVRQALDIVDDWAQDNPHFLVGDFNSVPGTDRYEAVVDDAKFVDTYAAAGGEECSAPGGSGCTGGPVPEGTEEAPDPSEVYTTSKNRLMSERIDYVFARGCTMMAVPDSHVIGDHPKHRPQMQDNQWLWPSDHLGVVSQIDCLETISKR